MNHKVFSTIEEAAAYVDQVSNNTNVYFATHVLKAGRVWKPAESPSDANDGSWSVRTQANARASRVLFFDLDVNSEKSTKYATQGEAAAGLIRFVTETKLPLPTVVSSGGGLHVYWILDRELDSGGEWLAQAQRLKQLAKHHGLKFDPARTTDSASVLRVAGTWNLKENSKRPVKVMKPGGVIPLTDWDARVLTALAAAQIAPKQTALAELGSNTRRIYDKPPPTMLALLKACPQMRRLAQLRGNNSEPEWYWGDVGVVRFTENGRENVHKISRGYPKYSKDETDAKIDQWGDRGATTCAKLEEVCGPDHAHLCHNCVFPNKATSSPVWAAHLLDNAPPPKPVEPTIGLVVEQPAIPNPPMPYRRPRAGGVEVLMESKDGKQYPLSIYPYDLYPIERSSNAQHETEQQIWCAHLPHDMLKTFTIEASVFVSDRELLVRLANNGVYAPKFPELRAYMSAYIQELQKTQPLAIQHNQLGWIDDHTKFVLPDKVIHPDGTAKRVALAAAAANAKTFVTKSGTLEEQVELLKFFKHPAYVPNQFYILASLGSAIFFATGHHGIIVHAAGDMGTSKSTALYTAAAMWGPPKKFSLNGTSDGATALGRSGRRDVLSNLPLCLDEITHIAADVAKNFAMNATQPGGRLRLKHDGSARSETDSERASMTLTTANQSLHSLLQIDNTAGSAGSVRVFEIVFEKRMIHLPLAADAFMRGLAENYGHVGERFIQAVVRAKDLVVRRVIHVMEQLEREADMRDEERFWFAAAAATLVAGDLACKLGLIDWDMVAIRNWLLQYQLPFMRGIVEEQAQMVTPASVLMDYLESINGDMIKMVRPHSGNISNVIQEPRGSLLAHYDVDDKIIYVLRDGFKRYCERRGQYMLIVLRLLHASCIVPDVSSKKTLGAGTKHAKGLSSCFTVNMGHQEIAAATLPTIGRPAPSLTVVTGGKP